MLSRQRLVVAPLCAAVALLSACAHETVSLRCSSTNEQTVTIDVSDDQRWKGYASGPDRIYAERGVTDDAIGTMGELLRRERAAIAAVTGVTPPPLAVALASMDYVTVRAKNDRKGRAVWVVLPREARDGTTIGMLAHEWTHAIVSQVDGNGNDDTRYLEDGLCDFVAHRVEQLVRGRVTSSTACVRGRELRTEMSTHPPDADLVALGREHTTRVPFYLGQEAAMRKWCATDFGWGYTLGFAYWVDRAKVYPNIAAEYLAAAHGAPAGAAERFEWLGGGARSRLDPRHLVVAHALDVVEESGGSPKACASAGLVPLAAPKRLRP